MNLPRWSTVFSIVVALSGGVGADEVAPSKPSEERDLWSLHSQATVISQVHGPFRSPYNPSGQDQGFSSLHEHAEWKTTMTSTLFLGRKLWQGGELYVNPEVSWGTGFSGTQGFSSLSNGEAIQADSDEPIPYLAQIFLRQTWGFGGGREEIHDEANEFKGFQDASRLVLTFGKVSLDSYFDQNRFAGDARTQFMNIGLGGNGAWDFPTDAHGYTTGLVSEFITPKWNYSLGAFAINGDQYYWKAYALAAQIERTYTCTAGSGAFRLLGWQDRAKVGNFTETLNQANPPDVSDPLDPNPTVMYRNKYGFGFGWEQDLTHDLGAFARLGWTDDLDLPIGHVQAGKTGSLGLSLKGASWSRAQDTLGVGVLVNDIGSSHREFLNQGGATSVVGDGQLAYGQEVVSEAYYSIQVTKNFSLSPDIQWIQNPAFNKDRGPVLVFGLRGHAEF